jgi:hypothetical protein
MNTDVPDRPEVARRIAEINGSVQHDLAALMDRIVPLTSGSHETAASFAVLRSRWQADAARLHAALEEIAACVEGVR